ncbi:MAG: YitT family protein [Parachlamydiales bacterium]|nr:YitT family protein [Parachlamydiales bacterium]
MSKNIKSKSLKKVVISYIAITIGALLAAIAIRIFLYPNKLIDGGVVGLSLIGARLFGDHYLPYFLLALNCPFIYLAYRSIRKSFVLHMLISVLLFAGFLFILRNAPTFHGDLLEIIVIGGALLGTGVGLIIRNGGCTDGTEILAILINRKKGLTVGQIILIVNIIIFSAYGWIFKDWHIAFLSLIMYIVAFKMIDLVIAGLEELKSVIIITSEPKKISDMIMHELGLGLTIIPGIGGFSGKTQRMLYIIVERLDLAALKEVVLREDPSAFMAIENLHEVAYGKHVSEISKKRKKNTSHSSE